ncbi:outer membrane protein OmpA-like peptidoglycan-associated protein [Actinocorallia herbida]|uniref:Outer membrane protein OmpA-like peptidoglycan-associated protein n=1 Tax=Actinocorallia herbida TaxID=58109 RepID=A0A3N1CZ43_9ACTN|nr:OmpA family protein [Actinocorallia herbida]ROO86522.1 outer membrane protein OmpA-like peptidoglycan-associated protein [Actinocorallia herbida]
MRRTVAAALCLLLLPGAAVAAEPDVPNPESSITTLTPEALDLLLEESVIPLEHEEQRGAATTVRISSDVLFEFDSATLTPEAAAHLARIAARLTGGRTEIAGFTDSLGAPAYNRKLSRQRAEAVKAELAGLGVENLTARGRGEADPVAPNQIGGRDNPSGRAENRRVEITFTP